MEPLELSMGYDTAKNRGLQKYKSEIGEIL
ncbi:MAG: hypothetical protein JWM16_5587 [Verrucomicrobiales bacterium]|nr:hypothetical protein [Verrucomicrobiales bacterium]